MNVYSFYKESFLLKGRELKVCDLFFLVLLLLCHSEGKARKKEDVTKDSSEALNPDGSRKDGHLLKMSVVVITTLAKVTLSGNKVQNYYIAKEEYIGVISRELLTVQVKGRLSMYGVGVGEKPCHGSKAYVIIHVRILVAG